MKKRIIACIIALAVTGTSLVTLSGCNKDGAKGTTADGGTRKVEEVVMPIHGLRTLNPICSIDEDTYYLSKLMYEGLFKLDENMNIVNGLAKDFTYNKDAGSVTINLADATWHDGKPFTARDVTFTFKAFQRVGTNCQYSGLIDRIVKIDAESDTQITVYFESKNRMSLNILTFPILPAHQFDSMSKAIEPDAGFFPIGTGQYKCKSYGQESKLVLTPNEEYRGKKAKNTLTFEILPNETSAYRLLEAGSVALMFSQKPDRNVEITKKGIETVNFPSNQVEFLGFNFARAPIQSKEVRQAISYGVNSERIIEECYYSSGMTNSNIFFPNYLGVKSSDLPYSYSLDKGAETLKKAGYTMGTDGVVHNEKGDSLKLEILVDNTDSARLAAVSIIEEDLKKLGIIVTVTAVDTATYLSYLKSGYFDVFYGGYQFDEQMDMRFLLGDFSSNYTRYDNRQVGQLLEDMNSGQGPAEMKTSYEQIKTIIEDEVPYFCVAYKTFGAIQSKVFRGEMKPVWNNYYGGADTWYSQFVKKVEETETPTKDKDSK